jgi:hypothetical protein
MTKRPFDSHQDLIDASDAVRGSHEEKITAQPADQAPGCDLRPNGSHLTLSRAALRKHLAEALARADGLEWGPGKDSLPSGVIERCHRRADAVLAVLPVLADRAAVLGEAAEISEDVANRIHASGDDHRAGGAYDVVDRLRQMVAEAEPTKPAFHLGGRANTEDCPTCDLRKPWKGEAVGMASGNEVFDPVARQLQEENVSPAIRRRVLKVLIRQLQGLGWDTESESLSEFADDAAIVTAFRENGVTLS